MKRYRSTILICGGTGCVAAGSLKIHDQFLAEIRRHSLQEEVNVVLTGCNGICDQGPVVVVYPGGVFYHRLEEKSVARITEEHLLKGRIAKEFLYERPAVAGQVPVFSEIDFFRHQHKVTRGNCGIINPESIDEYIAMDGWAALGKALTAMTPDQIIEEVKKSGLRGRGGAGFPTGLKWQFCKAAPGEQKYIICNADEGDPGAFMDRSQLEGDPQSVIEGMAIGARAIGADKGVIYCRAEYPLAIERVSQAIDQATEYGLLGKDILGTGFNFDIEIMMGAGAFVCGEETALMRSVEGKRGEPRPRPPFPAIAGLWEKPTVLNNVETLATIPIIIRKGGAWYASMGTEKSKGTKIFSLTGKIVNNGLVEVEMGTPMGKIIYDIGGGIPGGRDFKSVQCGGPSGGCIPKAQLNVPIDYEALTGLGAIMGSGGLVVMDENTCMVDTARFFLEFTQEESCGKCPPCRIGTKRMLEILERITAGQGKEGDIEELERLGNMIKQSALCGLGQTAPNPVLSTIRYFRHEYEAHIKEKRCPAAVCGQLFKAPCTHTCPVGLDVPGYVTLVSKGRFDEAYELIMEKNPLPGICGRVCTHPCESKCRREQIDEPISIRTIKRFVTDYMGNGGRPKKKEPKSLLNRQPVAVIGAGPAGLTAAYFLALKGHPVTVYEKLPLPGGMLSYGIPEYRLPRAIIAQEIEDIKARGRRDQVRRGDRQRHHHRRTLPAGIPGRLHRNRHAEKLHPRHRRREPPRRAFGPGVSPRPQPWQAPGSRLQGEKRRGHRRGKYRDRRSPHPDPPGRKGGLPGLPPDPRRDAGERGRDRRGLQGGRRSLLPLRSAGNRRQRQGGGTRLQALLARRFRQERAPSPGSGRRNRVHPEGRLRRSGHRPGRRTHGHRR